jgi:antitoxin component of MazEF toxin-antitoxin module
MTKKLVQHGNSAALIIDKPILELLKINFETPLEITTDGSKLIIAPIGLEKSAKRVKESLKKINNKYSKTLKKDLADAIYKELLPIQEKRKELEHKTTYVDDVIKSGAEKARKIASETVLEVKEKMGLD